jgi:hypothetical protein
MSADDHGEPVNTDDQVEEDFVAEEQTEEEPQEEPQEEDPELVALKEEIAKLEAEVKEKRRQVEYTSDQADEYSQAGYARKVAEMENMRRARSVSFESVSFSYLMLLFHLLVHSRYRFALADAQHFQSIQFYCSVTYQILANDGQIERIKG